MSFVITVYVREGIVMASDSRLSLNYEEPRGDGQVVQMSVAQSDTNYKTFLAQSRIGISTFGAADINGVPIAGYIESFISERIAERTNINEVPALLLDYFRRFTPPPQTQFHVAGYEHAESKYVQHAYHVHVPNNVSQPVNPAGQQGATWGGEADIMTRLLKPVAEVDQEGKLVGKVPSFLVPFQFFTLQDAIDFAVFAVRSTRDAIRFQPRPKTVGGPIDVLVLKPERAWWVQLKDLHGDERG